MKSTFASIAASLLFISLGAQAVDLTLHYCKEPTGDQFSKAAKASFGERKYKVAWLDNLTGHYLEFGTVAGHV